MCAVWWVVTFEMKQDGFEDVLKFNWCVSCDTEKTARIKATKEVEEEFSEYAVDKIVKVIEESE